MTEAINSFNETVETSFREFGMSLKNLKLEYTVVLDNYVEATIKTLYDVDSSDRFGNKDEIFDKYITFRKRRRGGPEVDK